MTLFADRDKEVRSLREERLLTVGATWFPDVDLGESYLYEELLAAEAEVEQSLRVFLEPVEVFPEDVTQDEIAALNGARYITEPAYDWDPEFFTGNRFGFIQTRQRPILSVSKVEFVLPSTEVSQYEFPIEWIRMDRRYGQIRIVPFGPSSSLPLNSWLLSVYGGGRNIPHMLRVRYRAGIENVESEYPNVKPLIKRMAVAKILDDMFLPTSGSVSVDGLSQSLSVDLDKTKERIEKELETLRSRIHGIRMIAL